jgi:virginiamycin A acetyltransferase
VHLSLEKLKLSGFDINLENINQVPWGDVEIEAPAYSSARLRWDTYLRVGAFTHINHNTDIGHSSIGRYSGISNNCSIGGDKHPSDWLSSHRMFYVKNFRHFNEYIDSELRTKSFTNTGEIVRIGHDSMITNNCIISRGVQIGNGAIVAPGSVVLKDVPDYAVVGGNPAKILKYRFPDKIIESLLILRWWDYSIYDFDFLDFSNPEIFCEQFKDLKITLTPYIPKNIFNINSLNTFK